MKNTSSSTKRFTLVTGATGQQGGAVARALLKREHRVRALVRDSNSIKDAADLKAQGAEIAVASFDDHEALVQAATGVDSAYVMTTPFEAGTEAEVRQGITVIDALSEAKVGHIVLSSVANANQGTGIPHFDSKYEVEKHLSSLGVPYSITAPVYFMDNLLAPFGLPDLKQGKLKMAMPADRPLQQIALSNIGDFAAALIERRESVFGKRFDIAGDELTGTQVAMIASKASGHKVQVESFSPDAMRKDNEDMALMYEWFDRVGYSADIEALRREFTDVPWLSFEDWASKQDWAVLAKTDKVINGVSHR